MRVVLLVVGKTKEQYLLEAISKYKDRLKHYTNFHIIETLSISISNKLSKNELIRKEGGCILQELSTSDYVVLLDEKGKTYTSVEFSKKLQSWMFRGSKRIVFVIGGAYGFSKEVYNRADELLSLSSMTFSHQIVRLFFVEQIYRGYTILRNEPYHH